MDSSFLSDVGVFAASRRFVFIRLTTYEDQKKADFLKSIYLGPSGQLENTTFAILSPDETRKLTVAGRGSFHAFREIASMAAGMNHIAKQYSASKEAAWTDSELPLMKNVDLAVNDAAADGLPLIITVADNKKQLGAITTHWPLLRGANRLRGSSLMQRLPVLSRRGSNGQMFVNKLVVLPLRDEDSLTRKR